jgi:hypothetical protein
MAGQLLEAARFVGLDAQQAQLKLGRCPGEIHRPIDRMGIAVLVHQADRPARAFRRRPEPAKPGPAGREPGSGSWRRLRIGSRTNPWLLPGSCKAPIGGERAAAADESAPVGLEAQGFTFGVLQREAVRDIDGWIVAAARSAVGQERPLFRQRLGLDEQLVERRMLPVRVVRRQRQFNVARQLEPAGAVDRLISVIRRISTSSSGETMTSVSLSMP